MVEEVSFVDNCIKVWNKTWDDTITGFAQSGDLPNTIDDASLIQAIHASINSSSKTYRYVLPTQLVAKRVNPDIDSKCIQVQRGGRGAFDARTIAHKVIVPFDRKNQNVLGGASEPYVNNPLRVPEVSLEPSIRNQQKNKQGWDNLYFVLDKVESAHDTDFTERVFKQVQIEIARRLSNIRVIYPTPRRVSLEKSKEILSTFISERSGGDRPESVATALFRVIGKRLSLYAEVRRGKTNAPDAASGQVADIECLDNEGKIILAVEAKDRKLEINHITDKINRIREQNVSELLYLVKEGVEKVHQGEVESRIQKEFSSGQNIYVFDLLTFSEVILALIGEEGRRELLKEVGNILDEYSSPISSKLAWSKLLERI